ncbi:hypothetical protein [Phenylobacterium sp.]|uniref:hypothetical protein n=1 Tax=Phenylobacterium sp. TaxID=1871053 RepID=UPI0035AEF249
MILWEPLTAQYGDLTYWGEWILHGETVHVRCDHGSAKAPVDFRNPRAWPNGC